MRKKIFLTLLMGVFCLLLIFSIASNTKAKAVNGENGNGNGNGGPQSCSEAPGECSCRSSNSCLAVGGVQNDYLCGSGICCCILDGTPPNGNGGDGDGDGGDGDGITIEIKNPLAAENFEDIINNLIDFVFNIAIVLTPLMIILGGVLFVTAAGNLEQVTRAKKIIIWTLVGFFIVLLAKGISDLIATLLGVSG